MSTITKERIANLLQFNSEGSDCQANAEQWEVHELARIALASLKAEPVAWLLSGGGAKNNVSFDSGNAYVDPLREVTPLYIAPPAPASVPEWTNEQCLEFLSIAFRHAEIKGDLELDDIRLGVKMVNGSRAAMLQSFGNSEQLEPVMTAYKLPEETGSSLQLRNLIRQRHAEWSQATFGDVGPVGPLKHLSKEALEAAEEPDDLSEWADMQFLLWDAQRRAGISDGEITATMEEKLKENMARQWPEPKDGEPRLHIKAAPQQEVK